MDSEEGEQDSCPVHLLSDAPADEDRFGSHDRVATSLATTIRTNTGGKAIAITGAYGSGKSTVVTLLREKLARADPTNTSVFTYDSWAHQQDPLRRSFLESLLRHFTSLAWLPEDVRREVSEALGARVDRSITRTESSLTGSGKILAITPFLVPFGFILLTVALADKSKLPATLWVIPSLWLGVVLAAAPLIAGLGIYLSWRPLTNPISKQFWLGHRRPHAQDSVFNLFIQKTRDTTRSSTTRAPELTTIEFQTMFVQLLQAALSGDRTLVLVMDNLDRLPVEQVQAVWATMRVFTEGAEAHLDDRWNGKVWLLVPLEKTNLTHTWSQLGGNGESAFDKTFVVDVSVPPPVLSNWHDFLKRELATALPRHQPSASFEDVVRLYDRHAVQHSKSVYPREIKLFINRLAVLHNQRGREPSLPMVAAFLLNESRIGNAYQSLTTNDFLDGQELAILDDDDWANQFAALFFNVAVNEGVQVLMGFGVQVALEKGDLATLERLAAIPGFTSVCQRVVDTQCRTWEAFGSAELLRATASVVELNRLDLDLQPAQQALIRACGRATPWALSQELAQLIVNVIDAAPARMRRPLFHHIISNLADVEVPAPGAAPQAASAPEQSVDEWAMGYRRLLEASRVYAPDSGEELGITGDVHFYLAVLRSLSSDPPVDEDLMRSWRPLKLAPTAVVDALAERILTKTFDITDAGVLACMPGIGVDWPWAGLQAAALTSLTEFTQAVPSPSALILALLRMSSARIVEAVQALRDAAALGGLLHQLYLAQTTSDLPGAGLLLLASLLYLPAGDISAFNGQAANGRATYLQAVQSPATAQPYADALPDSDWLIGLAGSLLDVVEANPGVAGLVGVFMAVFSATSQASALPPELIVKRFPQLASVLPQEQLVALLAKTAPGPLFDQIISVGFARSSVSLYQTIAAAHSAPPSFLRFIMRGLSTVTAAEWEADLSASGPLTALGIWARRSGSGIRLAEPLQEAVYAIFIRAFTDGVVAPVVADALGLIRPSSLRTLMRNLTNAIIAHADEHIEPVVVLAGEMLLTSDALMREADAFVRLVAPRVIDRGNPDGLAWVLNAFSPRRGFLDAAKHDTQGSLRDHVQALLDSRSIGASDRSTYERIVALASAAYGQR